MPFLFGTGIALALPMAIIFGAIGFVVGEARLARLFGILWGTDRPFNQKLHETLSGMPELPRGPVILILSIIIVAVFGYLLTLLR
ncbi:hypothetical protein [Halothiobacillus diazotrophicus]|nr:hypothetical protein [Halothiobacillus diazotrophicus]